MPAGYFTVVTNKFHLDPNPNIFQSIIGMYEDYFYYEIFNFIKNQRKCFYLMIFAMMYLLSTHLGLLKKVFRYLDFSSHNKRKVLLHTYVSMNAALK